MTPSAGPTNFPSARFLLCPSLISPLLHLSSEFQLQHKLSFPGCHSSANNSFSFGISCFPQETDEMRLFLRDSPVWDHRDNLRPADSVPISLYQPSAVKVLLEARNRSHLSPKMEFSGRMPECVTRWREAEEPRSRKPGTRQSRNLNNRGPWGVTVEHSHHQTQYQRPLLLLQFPGRENLIGPAGVRFPPLIQSARAREGVESQPWRRTMEQVLGWVLLRGPRPTKRHLFREEVCSVQK